MNYILSNPALFVLVLVLFTLFVVGIMIWLIPILAKKGVNVEKYIKTLDEASSAAESIISIADKVMPNNSIINILKTIDSYAKKGVNAAEQLYINSKLQPDERNAKAKDIVYSTLKALGVEVTPEIDNIINGSIEAEVLALGHKPLEIKQLQDTNSQLQSQLVELQNTNQQIQQQNDQLKQTINNIQVAAQVTVTQ